MKTRPCLGLALVLGILVTAGNVLAEGSPPRFELTERAGIQEIVLQSDILAEERSLLVRLPRGYEKGTDSYPVLFLLDAEWHFSTAAADVELLSECSYIKSHPVPEMIVVGVVNVDRNRDFTPTHCPEHGRMKFPTSGQAARFRRFLTEEALPVIDQVYRTRPFRVLAGWSLGGLFTIDTLLGDTPIFDSYLAISPSLWWDDGLVLKSLTEESAATGPPESRQLIITLGTVEKENGTMVAAATARLLERLSEHPLPNVTVEEVEIEGLGHNYSPKLAYFYGLATIFNDLTLPDVTIHQGLAAVDAYYAALTARYHFDLPVPEDAYSRMGWQLFEGGRKEDSGEVFRVWAKRHPQSALAQASLGSFCKEIGDTGQAVDLFRRAIVLEEQSDRPRQNFINDLRRDIDALQAND